MEAQKKYYQTWKNYPAETLQRMYSLSNSDPAKDAICSLLFEKLPALELDQWLQSRGALVLCDE
jgi:hypothetical protein